MVFFLVDLNKEFWKEFENYYYHKIGWTFKLRDKDYFFLIIIIWRTEKFKLSWEEVNWGILKDEIGLILCVNFNKRYKKYCLD